MWSIDPHEAAFHHAAPFLVYSNFTSDPYLTGMGLIVVDAGLSVYSQLIR